MKRHAIALTAMAALLVLAGCTGTTDGDPTGTPTPAPSVSVEGLPDGVVGATNVPTEVPNDVDLRKNVVISTCEASDGGWTAAGTATNPGDAERTFTITVFFTASTATVLGTGETTVTVGAGETGDWSISAEFVAPEGTLCVLRGVS